MLNSKVKGLTVKSLLVEEKLDIVHEFYASVTVDRAARSYVVLASTEGGVDIEEVAEKSPEKIIRYRVDPLYGFSEFNARKIVKKLGLDGEDLRKSASIVYNLFRVAMDYDAELAETNPFVKTSDGRFVAVDVRIIVDDNALFRHPELKDRETTRPEDTPLEAEARKIGLAYVDLEGEVGVLGNGAGLVMATLDLVKHYGSSPANFLDIGGGARADLIKNSIKIILSKPQVKVVLVNILGGITRCDEVAKGIVEALNETGLRKPLAVRMIGTREEEGRKILEDAGIHVYSSMEEAAQGALKLLEKR
ncbi:ADP-forming succinate--CoA ligase subunit beta [Candidatus Bathyarchaeota archaeon]|nr:MAG: ADP-forming succinate--CoA ligase subunit beta [Candidatus Bathyarchaeota archaeon]